MESNGDIFVKLEPASSETENVLAGTASAVTEIEKQLALATEALGAIVDKEEMDALREDIMRGVAELQEQIESASTRTPELDCAICGKQYKSQAFYSRHIASHRQDSKSTDSVRHCDVRGCDETFPTLDKLHRHKGRVHGIKPYRCSKCDAAFSVSEGLKKHEDCHSEERKFKCEYCPFAFKLRGNYTKHVKRVHLQQKVECKLCQKLFSTGQALTFHIRSAHTGEKPFQCSFCPMQFSRPFCLKTHELKHRNSWPYQCDECTMKFRSSGDLSKHKKRHQKANDHKCSLCPRAFPIKQDLNKHMLAHSDLRPFTCKICNTGFKVKAALDKHLKVVHVGEKKYKCEICEKSFAQSGNLKLHVRYHKNERRFSCPICPKTFYQKKDVDNHVQIHESRKTGVKKYGCDQCSKVFSCRKYLLAHRSRHTLDPLDRPHACSVCQRSFKLSSILKNHMKIHAGIKPFGCSHCGVKFISKLNCLVHERTHTGEKPYECSFCKKKFTQKGNRNKHEIRQHGLGEKKFECDKCSKKFFGRQELSAHTIRRHGEATLKCPKCPRTFTKRGYLQSHCMKHTRTHYNTKIKKTISCEHCSKWFKSQNGLRVHMTLMHGNRAEAAENDFENSSSEVDESETDDDIAEMPGTSTDVRNGVVKLEPLSDSDGETEQQTDMKFVPPKITEESTATRSGFRK